MKYYHEKALKNISFEAAIEKVTEALKEEGFGILTEIDVKETLKKKLDEARSRQNTLIARSNAAKAEKQLNQAMSGTGSDAFSKFEKMESKVEQMEAEAEAFGELNSSDKTLEEEFANLSNPSIDDELEKLKAQMNSRGNNE